MSKWQTLSAHSAEFPKDYATHMLKDCESYLIIAREVETHYAFACSNKSVS